MRLPFLDRERETARLRRLIEGETGRFGVLFGRRRCGKSRLLHETISSDRSVTFVGDDREPVLQRASLATEIGRMVEGFDRVTYPDWDALLGRWWKDAPPSSVLVLDELPSLVARSSDLPSILQKLIDRNEKGAPHLIVAGSSQRMMQGLVMDRSAPLFGRASEILKIRPLPAGWITTALEIERANDAVEAFAMWGGVPRYWELAADYPDLPSAVISLVLDPLGVLHDEPGRLLLDDLRDTTQAASILSLIGSGCHRVSEIAGRLGKPATSLARPLQRLIEMGLVVREIPFGAPQRGSKRSLYRIDDPFLRLFFRFVEPNRSLLEVRQPESVWQEIAPGIRHHFASTWEDLARESVPRLNLHGREWGPAARWWGPGLDRKPLEVDVVAEEIGGNRLLVGEVKWGAQHKAEGILRELIPKIERLPFVQRREVLPVLWLPDMPADSGSCPIVTAEGVLKACR